MIFRSWGFGRTGVRHLLVVMGLHKLSAGDGYVYLARQVAAHDATHRTGSLGDYYAERGESPGRWFGSGLTALGLAPGDLVSEAQMLNLFGMGWHPDAEQIHAEALAARDPSRLTAHHLGTPFTISGQAPFRQQLAAQVAKVNLAAGRPVNAALDPEDRARLRHELASSMFVEREGREPKGSAELESAVVRLERAGSMSVAGYDLAFSPVKSVSALWAIAPPEIAREVAAAHDAAVADTMRWLEQTTAFTRLGRNGVRQVDTQGLIAAAFTHRDSRAGDPDLHTHVAVSNKVQTLDGRWRAMDARVLHRSTVAASERYNTRLEAHLVARLGVRFTERQTSGLRKRPVREIEGVDTALLELWSTRRTSIVHREAELTAAFVTRHGRPPRFAERQDLAEQATLETRQHKHAPRSEAEQRETWRRQAEDLEPGSVDRILRAATRHTEQPSVTDAAWVDRAASELVATVAQSRATWHETHLRAEAERAARVAAIPLADLDTVVDQLVQAAVREHSISLDTDPLIDDLADAEIERRRDGASVHTVAGNARYTSQAVLDAEQLVIDAAAVIDGPRVDDAIVDRAIASAGVGLNTGQVAMVRELVTSGRRLQLALAPAGTGKTTALATLADAWTAEGGTVVGLAPSAAAARVLGNAIGRRSDTLAKLLHTLGPAHLAPDWVERIDAGTLLLVDEAGMASTRDLAQLVTFATERGASIRLIGDDRQLASVAAGGALRDIAATHGAVRLKEVLRFDQPNEAAATTRLRVGDQRALDFYEHAHRVHGGERAVADALTAWANDRTAGRDALLLATTREQVHDLNTAARALTLGHAPDGVALSDRTIAGPGEPVITRHNDRHLSVSATDWVKNGDRWTIQGTHPDGALDVIHQQSGLRTRLPADYVQRHVQLGYATTVHTAQGVTADTAHLVLTGTETREQLYVGMTRGRQANHVYLQPPDTHDHLTAPTPPSTRHALEAVLARDGRQTSATTLLRDQADPHRQLQLAVQRYRDLVPADPSGRGPLPWLPPAELADPPDRDLATALGQRISELADPIWDTAVHTPPSRDMPDWQLHLARSDRRLLGDITVWRTAHGIDPNEPHPMPTEQIDPAAQLHLQRRLNAIYREPDSTATPDAGHSLTR